MTRLIGACWRSAVAVLTLTLAAAGAPPPGEPQAQAIPNMGTQITPLAAPGSQLLTLNPGLIDRPEWLAGQAATTVVSPDNNTLLVLTSGYNRVYPLAALPSPFWENADSNDYVFIYDISTQTPKLTQVVQIPMTYFGIVFDPASAAKLANGTTRYTRFYVAGASWDVIHSIRMSAATMTWSEDPLNTTGLVMSHGGAGIGLNLKPNGSLAINSSVGVVPFAAGLGISKDGETLVVANYYNDSITIFTRQPQGVFVGKELDLRPGKSLPTNPQLSGVAGGEYPFWVQVKGSGATATAYVSSIRDREIVVVSLGATAVVTARIAVAGQPNKMILNAAQTTLYVTEDQSDTVDLIDTASNKIVETIPVVGRFLPASLTPPANYVYRGSNPSSVASYSGANPNSLVLSPDETRLYVTDGNLNCVSVIELSGSNSGDAVIGLIPAGWYPNSVSIVPSGNGGPSYLYVANQKSPTGANPQWCYGGYGPPNSPNCYPANQYNPQLTKATLQAFPVPGSSDLAGLTEQVKANNHFAYVESAADLAVMAKVREGIKHVIFIVKENRTFDQVLGDLPNKSNGDPTLVEFGAEVTPNQHKLATDFVTLDNFMATAEVSYDGWLWTTAAQAPDVVQHQYPVAYAYRGTSLDATGLDRKVNTAIPAAPGRDPKANVAARQQADPFTSNDPDVLPGTANSGAPDGADKDGAKVENAGYLWDAAMLAGLSVRNYGFFIDETRYNTSDYLIPLYREPWANGVQVAFPANAALAPFTDPYYRGFDNSLPDYWRYQEWARDFDARYKGNHHAGRSTTDLPALTLVRLMHDHTGNYSVAIDGVNTPDLQVADNDYAVGLLVEKIARSPYADSTLIFVVEDDAQDGGDHVDSHRTTAYVAGPYVKQGAVISTRYNTVNLIRTIEEVLNIPNLKAARNLPPWLNLNDALAAPMTDIFDTTPSVWSFSAIPPALLYNTALPLPPKRAGLVVRKPAHDASYWSRVTKGMDLTVSDRVDDDDFNQVLWKGLMGRQPYPARRTGLDLRENRQELLERHERAMKKSAAGASK
ncbi:MAG: phosphoesterase [Bryobacteraceae bacterium]